MLHLKLCSTLREQLLSNQRNLANLFVVIDIWFDFIGNTGMSQVTSPCFLAFLAKGRLNKMSSKVSESSDVERMLHS